MTNPAVQHDPALMWIYGIFSALTVRFGRRFLAQYEGVAIDAVHRDWARVLRDYAHNPAAVMWALDNLPDQPPMVSQFKALCASAPKPATKMLSQSMTSPEVRARMRELNDELQSVVVNRIPVDGKAWAVNVLARAERGEAVSYGAKRMAMQALGKGVKA